MKVVVSHVLKTITGDPIKRQASAAGESDSYATVKWAVVEALLAHESSQQMDADDKARRFDLALAIQQADGELDLSVEDVVFIKQICDGFFPPLVVGQLRRILDGREPAL